jgi:hypothetical protein
MSGPHSSASVLLAPISDAVGWLAENALGSDKLCGLAEDFQDETRFPDSI